MLWPAGVDINLLTRSSFLCDHKRMASVFDEPRFQAALEEFRAHGDGPQAEVMAAELQRLADYLVRRLGIRTHDVEDAVADGVARCFEFVHRYDATRTTAYNYFAQVIVSRLFNESARAARRCQLVERMTASAPAVSVQPTADARVAGAEVLQAVVARDGPAALVARALLYGAATVGRDGQVNVAAVRRITGLSTESVDWALADLRARLRPLAAEYSSRQ